MQRLLISVYEMDDKSVRAGILFSHNSALNQDLLKKGCILHPQELGRYANISDAVRELYPRTKKIENMLPVYLSKVSKPKTTLDLMVA